ncbi:DUF1566 domain-containing protein [bacterium]|nr:DUF1566 domain-containing protein [bacterium]
MIFRITLTLLISVAFLSCTQLTPFYEGSFQDADVTDTSDSFDDRDSDVADSGDSISDIDVTDSGDSISDNDVTDSGNSTSDNDIADTSNSADDSDADNSGLTCDAEQPDLCGTDDSDSFEIIPTNQTKCYNKSIEITCPTPGKDFYGQDAQYPHATRTFTIQGKAPEEEIFDSMTGLVWQRNISQSRYNVSSAHSHCRLLQYGCGAKGAWRLPTIEELSTIIDYGEDDVAIDEVAFPDTPESMFLSSTFPSESSGYLWVVHFQFGTVEYAMHYSPLHVRCVRGKFCSHSSRFTSSTVSNDVVVTDSTTRLIWTKNYELAKNWQEALSYCENLTYAEESDWRLPNINEIKTLTTYSNYAPASYFPDMPSISFWSSTTGKTALDFAMNISFNAGLVGSLYKGYDNGVRCVR